MAYSPIEQAYIDGIVSAQFPDPEPQPEPVMLADSGQVKSDAGQDYGSIGPIKRNKAQEALGYVGELLTKAGVQLDKVGLDVPVLGRITLKDLTVGESGKVLEDMSYGFMPVEGAGGFISGTTRIKPDAALELMNIAPTVGAVAKMGGKAAVKGVTKAIKATEGLPVGLSIKEVGKGVDELGFYSAASKAVDAIQQPKGTGDQFLKQIEKTPGVKPDEIKWTGLDDFLKSKKSVTKQEVQEYMAANRVEVKEVKLADPSESDIQALLDDELGQGMSREEAIDYLRNDEGATQFSKWQLPGGENYREIYLTLPPKPVSEAEARVILNAKPDAKLSEADLFLAARKKQDDYIVPRAHSSGLNEGDINRLAHLRVNDRVDVDGKKVLFVEEIQSDWHQAGRKKGYKQPDLTPEDVRAEFIPPNVPEGANPKNYPGYWEIFNKKTGELVTRAGGNSTEEQAISEAISIGNASKSGVPDAPFKTNWQELAMKRAIQMAAEGGYDRIAFTTGAQQSARYDLSKQVKMISAMPDKNGKYNIYIEGIDGEPAFRNRNGFSEYGQKTVTPEEFEDLVGKDAAKTIMQKADELNRGKVSKDQFKFYDSKPDDLTIGGEGMKGFYDNILPKFLDKYGKKWGAKTGMTKINVGDDMDIKLLEDSDGILTVEWGSESRKFKSLDEAEAFRESIKVPSVHYFEITPKMRESVVSEGQPLFAVGAGAGAGAAATKEENK